MEGKPADQLLCDSLILWVSGVGRREGAGRGTPPTPPLGLIRAGAPSLPPSLRLLLASSRFRAPFGLTVAKPPDVAEGWCCGKAPFPTRRPSDGNIALERSCKSNMEISALLSRFAFSRSSRIPNAGCRVQTVAVYLGAAIWLPANPSSSLACLFNAARISLPHNIAPGCVGLHRTRVGYAFMGEPLGRELPFGGSIKVLKWFSVG